jgi:predicted transcriptional regulator
MNITVKTGTLDDFFARGRAIARDLDAGKKIKGRVTLTFEKADDMVRMLTAARIRLVQAIRENPGTYKTIARAVHRRPAAVAKDILVLKKAGIVRVYKVKNPNHGTMNYVEPVSKEVKLEAVI